MQSITPSGLSYDQEKEDWLSAVSPALDKAPRQIILCFVDGELSGYIQSYTRGQMLMVEEIQIKKEYHRTLVFYRLCKYLLSVVPNNPETVEAYADKRNLNSIRLMKKSGMHICSEEPDSAFVHMRGSAKKIYLLFKL